MPKDKNSTYTGYKFLIMRQTKRVIDAYERKYFQKPSFIRLPTRLYRFLKVHCELGDTLHGIQYTYSDKVHRMQLV